MLTSEINKLDKMLKINENLFINDEKEYNKELEKDKLIIDKSKLIEVKKYKELLEDSNLKLNYEIRSLIAFRLNGESVIASCGNRDYNITVWKPLLNKNNLDNNKVNKENDDKENNSEILDIIQDTALINCLATYEYKGEILIASGNEDKAIKIWRPLADHKLVLIINNNDLINCLISVKNGKDTLIVSGNHLGTIKIWTLQGSNMCLKSHIKDVYCLCSFYIGEKLMLASAGLDSYINIWNFNYNLETKLEGHVEHINSLISIPFRDSTYLASASEDGSIFLWDTQQKKLVMKMTENIKLKAIYCLNTIVIEDITFLVSSGRDKNIIIWDIYTSRIVQIINNCHLKSIFCLCNVSFNKEDDGKDDKNDCYLISGAISKDLKLWKISKSLI